jgi:N-acetyl-anhydromuramyl-L-alanine amidase AmpD
VISPPFIAARWHGGPQQTINRIVIHGTVSPCQTGGARAVARFFATETNQTSAHYVVDPDEVIQCVGDHTIAWHDGVNTCSIGVELCDPVDGPAARWQDQPHRNMLARAATLVRYLCDAYTVPRVKLSAAQVRAGQRGICGHVDIRDAWPAATTHYDPGTAFPWNQFMQLVNGSLSGDDDVAYKDWPMDDRNTLVANVCDEMMKRLQPLFDGIVPPKDGKPWRSAVWNAANSANAGIQGVNTKLDQITTKLEK